MGFSTVPLLWGGVREPTLVGIWVEDMVIRTTVWKAACGLAGQAELRPMQGEVELVGLTDGLNVDQKAKKSPG